AIAPIFGEAHDDYYTAQQDAMTGHRGVEPPSLPMLPVEPIARVAAADALSFAWAGGRAPFRVQLLQGERIVAQKIAMENSVTLNGLRRIRSGLLALRVVDAQHQAAAGVLEVVPVKSLPDTSMGAAGSDPEI